MTIETIKFDRVSSPVTTVFCRTCKVPSEKGQPLNNRAGLILFKRFDESPRTAREIAEMHDLQFDKKHEVIIYQWTNRKFRK